MFLLVKEKEATIKRLRSKIKANEYRINRDKSGHKANNLLYGVPVVEFKHPLEFENEFLERQIWELQNL